MRGPFRFLSPGLLIVAACVLAPTDSTAASVGGKGHSGRLLKSPAFASELFHPERGDDVQFYRAVHWLGFAHPAAGKGENPVGADGLLPSDANQRGAVGPRFFAEVFRVRSGFRPSCQDCNEPISRSPEPASLLLFGTTLAGIGLAVRRLRWGGSSPDKTP